MQRQVFKIVRYITLLRFRYIQRKRTLLEMGTTWTVLLYAVKRTLDTPSRLYVDCIFKTVFISDQIMRL